MATVAATLAAGESFGVQLEGYTVPCLDSILGGLGCFSGKPKGQPGRIWRFLFEHAAMFC